MIVKVSDEELFSELERATTNQDVFVRIAAAESTWRLRLLFDKPERRSALHRFVAQNVPKWFDGETSPACRAVLVRLMPVPKTERLVTIVQQDADPQVRVAAIQRLIALDSHLFMKSADAFTNLAGEVTVEGRRLSLGAFVTAEKNRIRQTVQTDDDRGATSLPK